MKTYPFNRKALSLAVGVVVSSACLPSFAQSGDAIEEVVVRGFRASLQQSLDIKREATGVVDAIVAEDIGKFPDANVAESLQRIPGIYLARDGASNEGNRISIRGLGPEYAVTTINGAPVHTTSSGNVGGSVRDFNYDVFPSELFGAVKVYKTPAARLTEGGIGGVVDLSTPRPFDNNGQVIRYSLQASYNDASEQTNPKGSFLFSNTWDEFGVLFGVAHAKADNTRSGFQSTGHWNTSAKGRQSLGPFNFALNVDHPEADFGSHTVEQVENAFLPRFHRAFASENERDRTAFVGSLQFKNDRLNVSLDALSSELNDQRDEYTYGLAIRSSGIGTIPGMVPMGVSIDENNFLNGTFYNAPMLAESVVNDSVTEFTSINLRGELELTDTMRLRAQLTKSESDADLQRYRFVQERREGITARIDNSGNNSYPTLVILNADETNPNFWNILASDLGIRKEVDNDDMVKLELDWDYGVSGWEGTLTSGVSYVESSKYGTRHVGTDAWNNKVLRDGLSWNEMTIAQRASFMDSEITISPYAEGAGPDFPKSWSNYTRNTIVNVFNPEVETRATPNDFGETFTAEEQVTSFYIETDLRAQIVGRELRTNIGLRYSDTDVLIDNYFRAGGAFTPNNVTSGYDNLMPSVSAAYDLTEDVIVRASYGETITRSALRDIAANISIPDVFQPNAVSGNSGLLPQESKNIDFGIEWYFSEGGMLSFGAFKKDLTDTTITETVVVPWTSLGLPLSAIGSNLQDQIAQNPNFTFNLETKLNGGERSFKGYEIAYQQNFDFLPGIWSNLGALASYTHVTTDGLTWTAPNGQLFEVWEIPKYGYTMSGFWEGESLSVRLSWAYRDKTAIDTGENARQNDLQRWNSGVGYLDAAIGYKLTDSLELRLEGSNLNNEVAYQFFPDPTGNYTGGENRRDESIFNGRTITFGIRGSF